MPFSDGNCFICGTPAIVCSWDDIHDKTEYRCAQCSIDEVKANIDKHPWWSRIMDKISRKKKAKLALQELLDD